MPDPLMVLSELEELIARIGFRKDSRILGLVEEIREGIWSETVDRQRTTEP